ncbi:Integral membrane protein [Tritrichomonas foetus]|uniref:Integral membrane protein n=1 Tax=Tritrichomonas foetus TaxID=1144522 RepID=A0A1J4JMW7_9EUKA|nr:Integral membrane protein [Tritrichomonas foetus]|eukprot:OHS98875.1 Integral membrane protein [Tritrichomonas foetus]
MDDKIFLPKIFSVCEVFKFFMENRKIYPYLAFCVLCFTFGTSYALVSVIRQNVDPYLLSSLRMIFGCIAALGIFLYKGMTSPNYFRHAKQSLSSGSTPAIKSMVCGIINSGFPHSLITIAQRTVPSVAVQISQPCVSLFSLIFAAIFLSDERFSFKQFSFQLLSLVGTVLVTIPTFSSDSDKGATLFDYSLLLIAIASFGFGAVYIKLFLPKADNVLLCFFQLLGSSIYTTVYSLFIHGLKGYLMNFFAINFFTMFYIFCLGAFYTCTNSFLYVYIIRELGTVTANYTNVGQIVVGVIVGVLFLHEWKDYSLIDVLVSIAGLVVLSISIMLGLKQGKSGKNGSIDENDDEKVLLSSSL